jgi:hypothetical protein
VTPGSARDISRKEFRSAWFFFGFMCDEKEYEEFRS